jgi:2-polyprenyl-3-methyl-5-hydroxy-6-metoxy-1,4-benzoquinol methylase
MRKTSKSFLERSAAQYNSEINKGWEGLFDKKTSYKYKIMRNCLQGESVLELGCADGRMTQKLARDFKKVIAVDGSSTFIKETQKKVNFPNVQFICSFFEDFSPNDEFDIIVMTNILEHVDDPILVLKKAKAWLRHGGKVFVVVPNANSIHRMIGVKMGMLNRVDSLNDQDNMLGHKRVYTPDLLKEHIHAAGFEIEKFGGCMIKPLSNRQIEAQWSDELIDAFFALGEDFPELCSEIYAVLKKSE